MKIFRKLYNWTLEKSKSKQAPWFLSIVSFAESSFFPIPPDIILIPMVIANKTKAIYYASICTISSVFGGALGYVFGLLLFNSVGIIIINFYGLSENINDFSNYYNDYGAWIVLIAGFTPFPFKVITIASGLFQLNFMIFIIYSLVSRGARFFIIASLLYFFGEKIKIFIDKYFNVLTTIFIILLFISITFVKFI